MSRSVQSSQIICIVDLTGRYLDLTGRWTEILDQGSSRYIMLDTTERVPYVLVTTRHESERVRIT